MGNRPNGGKAHIMNTQTSKIYTRNALGITLRSLGYSADETNSIAEYAERGTASNLIIDANDTLFNVTARPGSTGMIYEISHVRDSLKSELDRW
jgi:hypothetical protein